jgi:hypothetical protein
MIDRRKYQEHRLVWLYVYGAVPQAPLEIDHINHDKTDNRIVNLREATRAQNIGNSKLQKGRTFKGAYQRGDKWISIFRQDGKLVWLGTFNTAEEAHAAYCKAAKEKFGEFFHSGIPEKPGVNAV